MSISPNVNKVVKNTEAAKKVIDDLYDLMNADDAKYAEEFKTRVDANLKELSLPDANPSDIKHQIRISYSSEFNIDGVADVIVTALETAEKVSSSDSDNPAMSKEAIEGYISVVKAVAAAARSQSSTAANLSYSMTQIGPGTFAFLYAVSQTVSDTAIFGSESVTGTAIYYRLVNSVEAVRNTANFKLALHYYRVMELAQMIKRNALKDVGERTLDVPTAQSMMRMAEEELRAARIALKRAGLDPAAPPPDPGTSPVLMTATPGSRQFVAPSLADKIVTAQAEAQKALKALRARGGDYAAFAAEAAKSLENENS
jgi:hypothetical protein